jgi:hypothetical protein
MGGGSVSRLRSGNAAGSVCAAAFHELVTSSSRMLKFFAFKLLAHRNRNRENSLEVARSIGIMADAESCAVASSRSPVI